uniref:Uncharacterized protein n=1 Tax=viral metagenome TaxID=1070528 RepID=A0A6C0KET6_9ZZZZ
MDIAGFAWPQDSPVLVISDTNSSVALAVEEDDGFPMQAVMWASVIGQMMLCFTAWNTVTARASEMWQYLWTFGMMYIMTTFLSGVTDDAYVAQWQDARATSYNILTFGAVYAVLPKFVSDMVGQPLEEITPWARGLLEMGTELVAVTGGLFAINGDGWFEHDILQHLPIAILGVVHTVNTVMDERYSANGKLSRVDRVSGAITGYVAYSMLKTHQTGGLSPAMCMIAQLCAIHCVYMACIDRVAASGAGLSDTAVPAMPRLADDRTNGPTMGSAGQSVRDTVQDKVDLGFRP